MWGRPAAKTTPDAAPLAPRSAEAAAAPETVATPSATPVTPAAPEPPRRRRAASAAPVAHETAAPTPEPSPRDAAPAPASVDLPAVVGHVIEPVVPASPAPAVASASVAPAAAPSAPMSRRARRVQTGEQPVVAVPPIAPIAPAEVQRAATSFEASLPTRDEPAPLLETVLAPAEPFELLEPAPEAAAERPAFEAPAVDASGGASRHEDPAEQAVEAIAKIVAAEAVAAAATTAPLAERRQTPVAPQPEPHVSYDERPRTVRVEPLTGPIPAAAASDVDEFEAAARLFSFTAETPVQEAAAAEAPAAETPAAETPAAETPTEESPQATASKPHVAPRRTKGVRGASFKRVATTSFSFGVFGIVGLMAVGMTTPVEAVAAASGVDASMSVVAPAEGTVVPEIDEDEIQAYVAPASAQNDTLQRTENYATTTMAELASEAGIKNFSNLFHNDPNSNIQWPFAVGVTMSYGFGMRSGRMHQGIDFTPGAGAPIQAIADGTVRVASEAGGAYGVHVIIDHMIDGQLVSSHYAHMQYGSMQVTPGQHVTVGTVLGRTGNTGRSYGAHTHFEILANGTTAIDPMPWLREHTDGTHIVG